MGKYHTVSQGECFSSLAHQYGFENHRAIFDHPQNEELKNARQNPNILYPNDVVYIPETDLKEYDGATDQKHTFILMREKVIFRIAVKDENDKPFANTRYELHIEKEVFEGETDGEGKIAQEIKANARGGKILLYIKDSDGNETVGFIPLELGNLDPVHEISGVQKRLNNLGFECGNADGILGEKTKSALIAFQKKHDLPESGNPCSQTCEKLRQIHDWQ